MRGEQAVADADTRSPIPGYGREFKLYVAGQAVSVVGDRIALIALVFLVLHLSHSYAPALALFYACRVVPTLVGGLFVGVVADSIDRRRLMIGCDGGRAVLLALVPALTTLNLAALFPMVVLLYALTLVFNTAARAALPDVVPESRMMGANSILSGMQNAADIAYALGGVLIFVLGYRAPFYLDAATFAFSATMVYAMRLPAQERGAHLDVGEVVHRIREGIDFIVGHPFLKWSVPAFAIAPAAGGVGYVLAPLYAGSVLAHSAGLFGPLRGGAFRFSALEVCLGIGSLIGSALAPRLAARWPRGRLFGLGLVGTGGFDALLAITDNVYVACAFMAASGLFFSLFIISGITLTQTLTPSEVRGRVVAARVTVINGGLLLGSAVAGGLLLAISIRTLWVIEGAVIVLSSLLVWFRADVRNER